MNTDENWQNYTEKKYIRFKSTKQSDGHGNKIQNVKNQLNVGKYRQKKQGNFALIIIYSLNYLLKCMKLYNNNDIFKYMDIKRILQKLLLYITIMKYMNHL